MKSRALVISAGLLSSICSAQSFPPAPIPTDARFVTSGLDPNVIVAQQANDDCLYKVPASVPITYTILITRVVGGAAAVDFNGTVTDPPGLANNGIIKNAKLKFSVSDGKGDALSNPDFLLYNFPLDDEVSVNGHVLDQQNRSIFGPGGIGAIFTETFDVPIQYLKFPHRTPGSVSSEVQNGVANIVTIIPNTGVFPFSLGVLLLAIIRKRIFLDVSRQGFGGAAKLETKVVEVAIG